MTRIALTLLAAAVAAATHTAQAAPATEVACRGDGTRVALLIGNQNYAGTMKPLDNPRRDIAALGALLCRHGFTVFRYADLDVTSFDATVGAFARAAKGTKTALIYYSGHGFAVGRRNWLAPVDARLGCGDISGEGSDVPQFRRRLVDLDEDVLARLEGAGDQIVILDACRVDPVKGCRGGASPSLIKGLVRPSANSARLIVYATQDGQVALDTIKGTDTSPLVTAMLKRLPEDPRRDWVAAMLAVSAEVHALTERRQQPNIDVNLQPKGCLAPDCTAPSVGEVEERVKALEAAARSAKQETEVLRAKVEAGIGLERREITRLLQFELQRVGCFEGVVDGEFGDTTRAALRSFTQHATKALPAELLGAAQVVRGFPKRVCPVVCRLGEQAEGDQCLRIVCPAGQSLKDGSCVAAVASTDAPEPAKILPAPVTADVARLLQLELLRVGCHQGAVDGNWNAGARRSLGAFNRAAGTKLDLEVASVHALDVVRSKTARVCPLECGRGFHNEGDRCIRTAPRKERAAPKGSSKRVVNSDVIGTPPRKDTPSNNYYDYGGCRGLIV